MDAFIDLLANGWLTFIYNLVETYIHEIIHALYQNRMNEQETHDLQCILSEKFLGIPIPKEIKNQKASDYYFTTHEQKPP